MPVVFSLLFSETGLARKARSSKKPCPTGHGPPPSSPPPPPVLHAATVHGRPRRRHQPQQRPALQVRRVGVHQEPASARGPRVLAPHVRRRAVARYTVSTAGGGREARAERRDDRDDDDDDDDDDARRRRRRHGRRGDLSRDAGHPARPPHPARRLREANAGRARGEDAASDSPGRAVLVASRRVPPGRARGVLARPRRGSRRRREKAAAAAAAARRRHGRPGRARAEDGGAPTPSGRGGAVAPRAVERLRWRHERGGHGPGRGASARAPVPVEDFLSPPARNSFLFSPPVVPRFRRSVSTLGFDAFDPRPSTLIRARPRTRRTYRASPGCSCRTTARRRRAGIIGTCSCCSSRRTTRRFARMGAALKSPRRVGGSVGTLRSSWSRTRG